MFIFPAHRHHHAIPYLPLCLSPSPISFFLLALKWMVFLRKSAADCCWSRRLECHCSRLIYLPPLSSCYAWSLNFAFLLFFPCYCSQIPPPTLPSSSHFSMQPSHSFRTWYMQHTCHGVSLLLTHWDKNMPYRAASWSQKWCPICIWTPENAFEDLQLFILECLYRRRVHAIIHIIN